MPNRLGGGRRPDTLDSIQKRLRKIDAKLNDLLTYTKQQNDQADVAATRPNTEDPRTQQGARIEPNTAGAGQQRSGLQYPGFESLPPEVVNSPFFDPFAPPLVPFHPPMTPIGPDGTPGTARNGAPATSEGSQVSAEGVTEAKGTKIVSGNHAKGKKSLPKRSGHR